MEPRVSLDAHRWLVHNARALRSLAHKLVRGEAAEDLIQETLARALERPPRLKSGSWLRVVCRNLFIAKQRLEMRRAAHEPRAAASATAPDTFDVVAHRAAVERVIGALHELSPDAYQVIQLRFYEDLIPTAMAARLSLPLSTVKRRLERAVQHLRESLGAHEECGDRDWRHALLPLLGSHDAAIGSTVMATAWSASRLMWAASAVVVTSATVWLTMPWTSRAPVDRSRVAAVRPRALVVAQQEPVRVERAILSPSTDHADAQPAHGSLRVALTWPDGTKAAQLPFMVMLYPDTEVVVTDEVIATTDNEGVALLDNVPEGHATVYLPDPCVAQRARIRAGEEANVALAITPGVGVEGEVVTREGMPVPDAEIWLGGYNESYPMTRTDADGKFALRDVPPSPGRQLSARGKNLAPSRAMQIAGQAGDRVHVRLELAGQGGAVVGSVHNVDGEPVAGARVTLTPSEEAPYYQPWSQSPPRATVFTDKDGKFRCEGMSPGQVPAIVRARPYASWSGQIDVTAESMTTIDVCLQDGAILEGMVRDQWNAGRRCAGHPGTRAGSQSVCQVCSRWQLPIDRAAGSASTRCALAHETLGAADPGWRRWSR
ncbi:MAG: sigma-70 family RNA polymerase sigma factor [Planctomycetota bacterium]